MLRRKEKEAERLEIVEFKGKIYPGTFSEIFSLNDLLILFTSLTLFTSSVSITMRIWLSFT